MGGGGCSEVRGRGGYTPQGGVDFPGGGVATPLHAMKLLSNP